ncbi:hypothetical protein sscle_10g079530 [Sclerotinia sclerotiorum 1980 UF-70]|uniref:SNF2 N-terminal domain-containing protein n=1 Tax=Sclerotinia sclerotiorum (strain ATCC 18683 / 1980 / Ss-1) TaxID=665079 RepID=A0A1D9QEY9_SCLS1|nr:hypothetical protein sscle_10g079530 [Sclerotinia sclerotiorum 1980 UF-70]
MEHPQTPSQHGITPRNAQHQLALEDIEQPSAVTYSATQSLHATLSHNHQQPVEPVERAGFSQVTPGNLDQLDRDDDAISYNIPPAKRQMRDRKPNTPSNTTGNGRTPGIRAQDSLKKSKPAKVIDTKAKIREEITNATLAQRKAFLIEKQDYFAPLLQQAFVPYQQLEAQPNGIKATLKPYQLAGLSYMVYLYKNGANGILGDDMGLGKTLQTLSLIQYLKENYPTSVKGKLQRPFLIVCPLSVLGSWMDETEKWTDLRR